ncbi:putative protein OS=Tsukamurella paurometabola (strain ATCC 8368 / DSM / CCUG 35730 /CIP 100753 / JCM 10117 / KCTC 9821 / NBRC 16120 / NCIMB 702349/ NCTC 13040) OX=521096 GN=Tpau_3215 PE=4 SV=1 [Tsukamurella paurometabola]|uniref:Uncharacterized protein n=1 Tax=Tsukamurella paurometabola (strain ATCC 8368 / DSM 20162 / CCUG 35730 / CIP 100753 / JCM 10117 / KCTC 9821 / NBRC 16120 / NCIMB 702349 / NCTC 13040) TaxID=521096 RepID=D5UVM0_TSUPD|nr:hypothetical protein [Tsukamurella paurometabola]ADG79802.1 hypothetical protein Tpau_3215 [Tsukamurella paurometabola DSM 20162]SUP37280.1 Uncharacterised protein [Tsukamurella paurometabola]
MEDEDYDPGTYRRRLVLEVEELIARAWGAVRDAGVPEPLQELAFKQAIDFLTRSAPGAAPAPSTPTSPASVTADDTGKPAASGPPAGQKSNDASLFDKFSEEASISVDDLQEVYYFDESGPHLMGPRSKFGSTTKDQAQAVALAITTARNYALDETETTDEVLRAECQRLKCDPKGNWAKVMGGLSTLVYTGPPRGKVARVKPSSHQSLQALVTKIRGAAPE